MVKPDGYRVPQYRSGIGVDVHAFADGRRLILGGVTIPYPKGLQGHSDADVLIHAIMDALLGAAGQGDIGEHFPDTSKEYKGISSVVLLGRVGRMLRKTGFDIANIDAVLLAERPKISPFKKAMRTNIAQALGIDACQVNIKATTNEGLGFVGRKEGMAAYATAMLTTAGHQ